MKTLDEKEFHSELQKVLNNTKNEVYTIRIVKEDDDTFDIRIWDERAQESCEDIEEGHFETFDLANKRLKEIVASTCDVTFLRIADEL